MTDEKARVKTDHARLSIVDEATAKAAHEILLPIFEQFNVYDSIESKHVQPAQASGTTEQVEDVSLEFKLDHENPYHLQWAYEQTGGIIGETADYFDVTKTTLRDHLTGAGIHDPEAVNGPSGYRHEDTLRETFEENYRDLDATADEFGVSTKTIRNWLNRFDIDIEPPWQDKERFEHVWYDNDEVVEWTADAFDASPSTIRRWGRRFGFIDPKVPNGVEEREEAAESFVCEECGRDDFDSERAKNIHKTRTHGKEEEGAEEEDEPDDSEGAPEEELWCGHCAYGPVDEVTVRSHHDEEHDGEPIIWDVEPAEEDLHDQDEETGGSEGASSNEKPSVADGGVQVTQPSETGRTCQNCGSHVTRQYARVFAPDEDAGPRVCPNCEDMVRDRDGVRPKRNGGGGQ